MHAAIKQMEKNASRDSCPCLHIKPCNSNCSCVNEFSSYGCQRCCSYGNKKQQQINAKRLAKIIDI